jgi:endoglucanase
MKRSMFSYFIIISTICGVALSNYYIDNATLYRDDGQIHHVHGINWYGMETDIRVFEGLWAHDMTFYFDLLSKKNFNTIRVPFALEGVLSSKYDEPVSPMYLSAPYYQQNYSTYDIMDQMFQLGEQYSIDISMDLHRLHFHHTSQLWYDSTYTQEDMLYGWSIILTRFQHYSSFRYIDLYNEPHGISTVDTGNRSTDWDGFVIDSIPSLVYSVGFDDKLIWVNGIAWGQDMRRFSQLQSLSFLYKQKLIMSPHSYGPTLTWLPNDTYSYLEKHLDSYFGYLSNDFPIIVGEWGGNQNSARDRVWMAMFTDYLIQHRYYSCFWALNPDSKDVKGYLLSDWTSIDPFKEELLDRIYTNFSQTWL